MGSFGSLQAGNPKLLIGKQFTPLSFCFFNTTWGGWIAVSGPMRYLIPRQSVNRWQIMLFMFFLPAHKHSPSSPLSHTPRHFIS